MKNKYFVFKEDYEIKYPKLSKELKITIPAGQPILISRVLKEYGYCYLFGGIDAEIALNLGVIKSNITKDEEINMWKIFYKCSERWNSSYITQLRKIEDDNRVRFLRLQKVIDNKQGIIVTLKKAIKAL